MTTISAELPRTEPVEKRFAFGKNWARFLSRVGEVQVEAATKSLQQKLGDLSGKSFLDIGCGSGLHSLAAWRLGASRIYSFDFDADSVETAAEMRRRFAPESRWTIERGSVLDVAYLRSLGSFDVVYSWGVLHHTGAMWKALENVLIPLAEDGILFISIYNDQGSASRRWKQLKKLHNDSGKAGKLAIELATLLITWGRSFSINVLAGRPGRTIRDWQEYSRERGMSPWHDVVDWAGGYPFEVAKPEEIFSFYKGAGLTLEKLKTCGGGKGCNEFVFRKAAIG